MHCKQVPNTDIYYQEGGNATYIMDISLFMQYLKTHVMKSGELANFTGTKLDLKTKVLKGLKKIKILSPIVNIMKKHMGSVDYRNATPVMRDILVKTVNQDLSEYAKKIKLYSINGLYSKLNS